MTNVLYLFPATCRIVISIFENYTVKHVFIYLIFYFGTLSHNLNLQVNSPFRVICNNQDVKLTLSTICSFNSKKKEFEIRLKKRNKSSKADLGLSSI